MQQVSDPVLLDVTTLPNLLRGWTGRVLTKRHGGGVMSFVVDVGDALSPTGERVEPGNVWVDLRDRDVRNHVFAVWGDAIGFGEVDRYEGYSWCYVDDVRGDGIGGWVLGCPTQLTKGAIPTFLFSGPWVSTALKQPVGDMDPILALRESIVQWSIWGADNIRGYRPGNRGDNVPERTNVIPLPKDLKVGDRVEFTATVGVVEDLGAVPLNHDELPGGRT